MALSFMKCADPGCEKARGIGRDFCPDHEPATAAPCAKDGAIDACGGTAAASRSTPCPKCGSLHCFPVWAREEAREVPSGDSPDGQHPAQGLVGAARPGHASPAAPGTGSTGPKNPDRSAPEPPARVAFTQPSVNEIPDAKLLERAVRNSRPRKPGKSPRWHAVSVVFALGSTFAMELCRKYGVDPHEQIEGPVCETCAESAAGDR